MTPSPLNIGRYQVTDRLGHGGMGTVYLARDPSLERFVAIKLMRIGFDNAELRERFVREARAVAGLRHPCIVTLFEYGDHEGQPFIVMEYVNGKTLASIIGGRTPMTLTRRLQLIEDLCRGLEHAHKAGIIHRDVKPANIMVDGEGTLKILDFGIAKQGHAGLTRITGLVGTPRYMSPEQISGRPVTRRSDIFSVGLVSYELLALAPAFTGDTDYAVMNAILTGELPPLTRHQPDIDPRIERVVEKALERDPDRRYQDLSQMRRDVERIRLELVMAEPSFVATIPLFPRPQVQQLEELAHRRAQQIAANLENAERAFELGDYGAALAACEDVLIIDPQEPRGLEGLQRAQSALAERQALAHLNTARQHFESNDLTLAENDLRLAFALAPALREGFDLQAELGSARQRKEQRSRSLKIALDRAKIRFSEGAYESAMHAADEALGYDPGDTEALRLKADAVVALDEQRRRAANRRAQSAVEEATWFAARDRYDEALNILIHPAIATHALVLETRIRVERSRAEFERLKADANATVPVARVESTADTVRLPRPDTHIQIAAHAPALAGGPGPRPGARVLAIDESLGLLPGPVRPRRPKPSRRPCVFLDVDGTTGGGARTWFQDQLFVPAKQGHNSIGFGTSLTLHAVALAGIGAVVLARPELVLAPPNTPLVMVTAVAPPPPPVVDRKPVPANPTRSKGPSRPVAAPTPASQAQAPALAPVEAPAAMPTTDPLVTLPVARETVQPVVIAPPSPLASGGINATVSEIPVNDYDQDPVLLGRCDPKVPAGASGTVRAEVTILPNGHVSRVQLLDANSPYAALVMDAARQCVFQPARRRGRPVTVLHQLEFKLGTNK